MGYAIQVSGVSKSYPIYAKPHHRLLQALVPRLLGHLGRQVQSFYKEFWALNDISFSVGHGQTVGIIGRNGSGKSTILQIVCGTLQQSSGSVEVRGRVAALLELGSGFNPEFTGRENVYLNGRILGLSKDEIEERFSDIEAFADIGPHIDQPVKTYSSGMVVRLAFSVLAHVDADVLVIDEALAVGDAVFTQKCMRFLRKFRETGTVLFVSHDASSILNLCDHAIWLHEGRLKMQGGAEEVSNAYLEFTNQQVYGDAVKLQQIKRWKEESFDASSPPTKKDEDTRVTFFSNIEHSEGWVSGAAEIVGVELCDSQGVGNASFVGGEVVELIVKVATHRALAKPIIGFFVKDRLGQALFGDNTYAFSQFSVAANTILKATFRFRLPLLPNGKYPITIAIADGDQFDHVQHHWLHDAAMITVNTSQMRYGLVGIPFEDVRLESLPITSTPETISTEPT